MIESAVTGVPSVNLTPWRKVKIQRVWSLGSIFHAVASPGVNPAICWGWVKSQLIKPSKAVKPRNRYPSPPLFGMPLVVGMSAAVIAMRSVCAKPEALAARVSNSAAAMILGNLDLVTGNLGCCVARG